ncbi:hypothetical protein RchiOBHm_Chr2g0173961 [Rosa chinensis]|uniref:Uncharacterized protein n=1 Tax=Rosa chinensis TaxID=74649 RepID=A0A2P6S5Z6_ROSCH|nr:hypothetical protein RchiOBHm_Chr2g0173961 [Rosa chinensis]
MHKRKMMIKSIDTQRQCIAARSRPKDTIGVVMGMVILMKMSKGRIEMIRMYIKSFTFHNLDVN